MYRIEVSFEQEGKGPVMIRNGRAGQTILEICLQHDIDLPHTCGGVCSCSSCHIYVISGEDHLEGKSRREEDFIKRAPLPRVNSRLACQCLLIDPGGEVQILVPEKFYSAG